MSDLSSLSAQLPDNLAQLAQLDELLQADPDNEELQSLQADLRQVITMTLELQRAAGQLNQEDQATVAAAASTAAAAATTAASTPAAAAHPAAAASQSYAGASTAAVAAASFSPAHSFTGAPGSVGLPVSGVWPSGSRVLAAYKQDGKYYVARVDRVDEGAEEYTVTYLEYNQQAVVAFDRVRPWAHAQPDQLRQANTPVKALFPEDGLFYNASIEGPSGSRPGTYVVKFGHLGGGGKKKVRVEVPLQDICLNERFINPISLQATANASAKPAPLTEDFPTPAHLVVLPTDSEAVRQGKVKKLKKLKFDHKKAFEEQESNKRKSSWQDFKAGKTMTPGGGGAAGANKRQKLNSGLVGLKKLQGTSMFATSDAPDAVVGVVGSGRGMTENATIKKIVFAAPTSTNE